MGGVVRRYNYRYPHIIIFPTPLVLAHFVAASLLQCSFLKCFFDLVYFCAI